MSFNAQIRADIETLDVTINNYERMANAPQAWERIKKILAEEKFTSTNSAMDAILRELRAVLECQTCSDSGKVSGALGLLPRAKQHHA